eukprot:SAG31_NODE_3423_length_4293_cov_9.512399_1_plen_702_part_10
MAILTASSVAAVLKDMGESNSVFADKLFDNFDSDKSGTLDAQELTSGMMMLTTGSGKTDRLDKMGLIFDMYGNFPSTSDPSKEKEKTIGQSQMTDFLRSMLNGALVYIDEMCAEYDRFLGGERGSAADFSDAVHRQLRDKMERHIKTVVHHAFMGKGGPMRKRDFLKWVEENPKMLLFVTDLGKRMHSSFMARNKTSGIKESMQKVSIGDLERILKDVRSGTRMSESDVKSWLAKLNLRSDKLKDRIMNAFQADSGGTIEAHEFVSSLAIICSGDVKQKLGFAFKMYDTNRDGSIQKPELHGFMKDFFAMSKDQTDKMLDSFCSLFPGDDARFKNQVSEVIMKRTQDFINKAVDQALKYGANGEMTFEQFSEWCGRGGGMADFLGDIGSRWLESMDEDSVRVSFENDSEALSDSWSERMEAQAIQQEAIKEDVAGFFAGGKRSDVGSDAGSSVRIGSPKSKTANERRDSTGEFLKKGIQKSDNDRYEAVDRRDSEEDFLLKGVLREASVREEQQKKDDFFGRKSAEFLSKGVMKDDSIRLGDAAIKEMKQKFDENRITLREAFRKFDVDRNEFIDHQEFRDGIELMRMPWLRRDDVTNLIRHFDRDGDGRISFRDFMRVFDAHTNIRGSSEKFFREGKRKDSMGFGWRLNALNTSFAHRCGGKYKAALKHRHGKANDSKQWHRQKSTRFLKGLSLSKLKSVF